MADSASDMLAGSPAPAPASAAAPEPSGEVIGAAGVTNVTQGGDATAAGATQPGFDWQKLGGVTADEDIGYLQTKAYKTPADVLKALRSAEKLIGLDKIPMPKDDLDTEGWNRVYTRLGRPESPDQYDIKLPDNVDKPFVDHMLKAMHGAGASQKLVQAALKAQLDFENARTEEVTKARELQLAEDWKSLKSEWGNGYDTQVEHARRAIRENGIDKDTLGKIEEAIGPKAMLKLFAGYGSKFAEDNTGIGDGTGGFGKLTPQQAKYKIETLKADKEWVRKYTQGSPAERELAMKEMRELQEAANPL